MKIDAAKKQKKGKKKVPATKKKGASHQIRAKHEGWAA